MKLTAGNANNESMYKNTGIGIAYAVNDAFINFLQQREDEANTNITQHNIRCRTRSKQSIQCWWLHYSIARAIMTIGLLHKMMQH